MHKYAVKIATLIDETKKTYVLFCIERDIN
jgi:hypothetical protein